MRRLFLTLSLVLAGCTPLPVTGAADPLEALQARIIRVSETVTPSVVHIEAVVRVNDRRKMVTGSGFVMRSEGIVLTNEHVVQRAEKVSVIFPGRSGRYPAEVVGTDKQTDLAVVRVEAPEGEDPFHEATLGDSDRLEVGEWVVAIGNPYGLEGTVSLGIVSAKGRNLNTDDLLNEFIQTDAMIDRGSSGGPLVNLRGEVVGINSRGQGRGIGFTIPINTAKQVAADLLREGSIARAYLGVAIQPLDRELARHWGIPEVEGVIVNGVAEDSPAAKAGLRAGDILRRFDGHVVKAEKEEDLGRFQRMVATSKVGQEVDVELLREGKAERVRLSLAEQPKVVPDEEETPFGFTVQEVTEHLVRKHRLDRRAGVVVSFVERGSEGEEAGMVPGDLIQHLEDRPVPDIDGFREALGAMNGERPFLIRARRGTDPRFMLIVPRNANGRD
jgi:serine protease Do